MVTRSSDHGLDASPEMPAEISGLRMTRQRWEVYRLLMDQRDHPTANDVFMRIKDRLPNISLATVYNCLELVNRFGSN